jgi:TonB family protein
MVRTLISLLLCLPLVAVAESAKPVAHDLKGKIVFLRGMYSDRDLNFDAQGNPTTPATPGPFSISAVKVEAVHVGGGVLQIEGVRCVILNPSGNDDPRSLSQVRFVPASPVNIVIAEDPSHPDALRSAVNKVFALSLDDAVSGKSPAERRYVLFTLAVMPGPGQPLSPAVSNQEIPDPTNPADSIRVYKTGQVGLINPRAVYTVDPAFTEDARKKKLNGTYIVGMIVDTQGFPIRVHMIRSPDPGLEENAIAAVSQYRFSPATLNGKPVPVELAVEITFRIY